MTLDQELREKALELAVRMVMRGEDAVDLAQRYYDFLRGQNNKNNEEK